MISKEELWRSLRERPEALEELRLRSVGRESELIVGRALLSTGAVGGDVAVAQSVYAWRGIYFNT